ncbi:MAG: hypothetical protein ABI142_08495, partial [Bryocella sp.]
MKRTLILSLIACGSVTSIGLAQSAPMTVSQVAPGFQLPQFGGDFSYSLSASQSIITGYSGSGGAVSSTNLSGNLAYASSSETHPFGIIYSGGYMVSESNAFPSSAFHNLALSQSYKTRNWNFVISDTISYLPMSPVSGLSGIPGIGDLGISPVQVGTYTGSGILSNYAPRVSNIVGGTVQRSLTGRTSVQGGATYAIERFVDHGAAQFDGYDSNQLEVTGGLTHRLNARNSFGASYVYSDFTYTSTATPFSFKSNGVNVDYVHHWSPRLALDVSMGPQWNSGSTFSSTSISLAAAILLSYSTERSSFSLAYVRGTSTGTGVVEGTLSDTVGFTAQRRLSRVLSVAATASYARSRSLPNLAFAPFTVDGEVVGGQATRGL